MTITITSQPLNNSKIAVIKFGSSILPDVTAIPNAIHEVYQYLRAGYKVLVVISALGDTTNNLVEISQQLLGDNAAAPPSPVFAELLATGEIAAASLFTLALDRAGIPANKLDHTCLQTEGHHLDAGPYALQVELILNLFKQYAVLVIPGFIGVNRENCLTLLGRGGSDFSAVFAAWALNAEQCVIYKDTHGIFDQDPNKAGAAALPYHSITYDDCLQIPYPVIQYKAVKFAKENNFSFTVKALARAGGTIVGAATSALGVTQNIRKLRVILLGLGTVGQGVYQHLLTNNALFEIVGIGVSDLKKYEHYKIPKNIITNDLQQIITRDCDVVVELLGGIEPSGQLITQALLQKCHVVTANKALIAERGQYLAHIAAHSGVNLLFSAAVAGSVPIVETLKNFKQIKSNNTIQSITAVLNGTSNFILDKIRQGETYAEAIKSAQIAGFAEADPTLDLDGTDAAQKLIILARLAFNQEIKNITIEGIQNLNAEHIRHEQDQQNSVRLIANCELKNNVLSAQVTPCSLSASHPLANVADVNNGVLLQTTEGVIALHGKGAGRWPTAEAVYADLLEIFFACQAQPVAQFQQDQFLPNITGGVPYEALDTISTL